MRCILLVILSGVLFASCQCTLYSQTREIKEANISQKYYDTVTQGNPDVYSFTWNLRNDTAILPLRLSVSSNATDAAHLLVVVRQSTGVLSWAVPFAVEGGVGDYNNSSRTICPDLSIAGDERILFVDISTAVNTTAAYTLEGNFVENYNLEGNTDHHITLSPPAPQYFTYSFLPGEKFVQVSIKSPQDQKQCSIVSVQSAQCPIYDLGRDISYSGARQTFTTQAGVLVDRDTFSDTFTVVLLGLSSNEDCVERSALRLTDQKQGEYYEKNVTIRVIPTPSNYAAPILAALGMYLGAWVFTFLLLSIRWCKEGDQRVTLTEYLFASDFVGISPCCFPSRSESARTSTSESVSTHREGGPKSYGAIPEDSGDGNSTAASSVLKQESTLVKPLINSEHGNAEGARNQQAGGLGILCRPFKGLCSADAPFVSVAQLCKSDCNSLDKKLDLYPFSIIVVSIFYGLPVLQLVYAYQQILDVTGDQDLCYYNFDCARRLGSVSAFNNVYSNIGYVLLGILFVAITMRRHRVFRRRAAEDPSLLTDRGLPQSYGIYYALGLSLAMEGVMSGCFHVCPSKVNFQFDTSFMYVLAMLSLLRLYQNRHPDVIADSVKAVLFLAIVVAIVVCGVLANGLWFWICFFFIYIFGIIFLNIHLYFFSLSNAWTSITRHRSTTGWCAWITAIRYPRRMFLLTMSTLVNLGLAIYGMATLEKDFPSYILRILLFNLFLYLFYYVIMKMCFGERLRPLTIGCILCCVVCGAAALHFYIKALRNLSASPAVARERNSDCVLMGFYDNHDIWHFLSAWALFFYAMILLTIDDDLVQTPRDDIVSW